MAVAGLHSVSILESSFLRESQPEVMTRRDDSGRASTRASSLLQMWRELEDEHAVNHSRKRVPQHRGDGLSTHESRVDVYDGHESEHSCISEDFIIHENDFGSESRHDNSFDMGDIERERVRKIFREWASCAARERTSSVSSRYNGPRAERLGENEQEREWVQRRSTCLQCREDQGTQIEHVVNVSVVNLHNEGHSEHIRRGFHRFCGRQALIDMLNKAERERQQELQGLLERQAVSQFSHRNRIQSLLRGRFLRNDGVVDTKRPTSIAASELGFLRQRHTVSGLREEFLSRLDSSCSRASSSISDTSSNIDINGNENNQIQSNNMQMAVDECHEQTDSCVGEIGNHGLPDERTDIGSDIVEDTSLQKPSSGSEGSSGKVPENEFRRRAQSANIELIQSRDCAEHVNHNEMNKASPSFLSNRVDELEGGAFESVDQHQSSTRVEGWEGQALESDNTGLVEGDLGTNDWRDGRQSNEWLESDEIEMWHEDYGFQGPEQSLVELPSEQNAVPAPRMDPFYLSDEDNVRYVELRELLSRRSVSTLLGSGFRESLDQIVRSSVERQSHGPLDWDQSEEQSQLGLYSSSMQQLWDQEPQQPYGMEWDIINDMRVDMARLQQRMNNMQRMLEACMDMQLELQRSIRQEVSAALNCSGGSAAGGENDLAENRSKWDCVSKGICCMCSESGIDSLLCRCGHMCTCSQCANGLVQKGEKCPMCKAPVVDVIRAYSVL